MLDLLCSLWEGFKSGERGVRKQSPVLEKHASCGFDSLKKKEKKTYNAYAFERISRIWRFQDVKNAPRCLAIKTGAII